MSAEGFSAWGRLGWPPAAEILRLPSRSAPLPATAGTLLPYGNGRSYGDVCLNPGGALLAMRGLDRFIAFDADTGVLVCEAGALLADILDVCVPRGWFLPVTPGTRHVTVGGAIANDVHGKNHHAAGSFGAHLRAFELLRSDGSRRRCAPDENPAWFAATVGGLGLTGVVTWAELQLRRIAGNAVAVRNTRFTGLDAFFALNAEAERQHEYAVAWIDCLAKTPRGVLIAGDHAATDLPAPRGERNLPLTPPFSLINETSLRAFNAVYYGKPWPARETVHHRPYFYPLDAVGRWNRLYGPRGFYQYQSAVPPAAAAAATAEMLAAIAESGQGSFLAVLKNFGERPSPGLLSFPMAGTTLALDFPNRGAATLSLFERLDAIVLAAGGRLYPAKDARMPAATFRAGYPRLAEFSSFVDPKLSSGFWRRVMEQN
ncbi:MAG: FAD-binding oxidoreductase [Rhodocyclaceae bacterium]|nr:FAD-binding oxidoreductase [Rhodocyclaceae bacterium]